MSAVQIVLELRKLFDQSTYSWVVLSLRQDRLVWDYLHSPDALDKAIEVFSAQPEGWSPASLSMLALDSPVATGDLISTSISDDLKRSALEIYQQLKFGHQVEPGLAQAGLLALAL